MSPWRVRLAERICHAQILGFVYHHRAFLLRLLGARLCWNCHRWPVYPGEYQCFTCDDPEHYL